MEERVTTLEQALGHINNIKADRKELESVEIGKYYGLTQKCNDLQREMTSVNQDIVMIKGMHQKVVTTIQTSHLNITEKYEAFIESHLINTVDHVNKVTEEYKNQIQEIKKSEGRVSYNVDVLKESTKELKLVTLELKEENRQMKGSLVEIRENNKEIKEENREIKEMNREIKESSYSYKQKQKQRSFEHKPLFSSFSSQLLAISLPNLKLVQSLSIINDKRSKKNLSTLKQFIKQQHNTIPLTGSNTTTLAGSNTTSSSLSNENLLNIDNLDSSNITSTEYLLQKSNL